MCNCKETILCIVFLLYSCNILKLKLFCFISRGLTGLLVHILTADFEESFSLVLRKVKPLERLLFGLFLAGWVGSGGAGFLADKKYDLEPPGS